MKYWFYAEGNILGPYAPDELLSMPAFGHGSLVCPETSGGDNPGDWRPAENIAEIADALSVGAVRLLPGQYGAAAQACEPALAASAYYEAKDTPAEGYGNLLDTIDNILGAYKDADGPTEAKLPPDFDLMHNFDVRLSKIQEELEAARWEKNLLLEKMRARDSEESRNKERIAELEQKLQDAVRNSSRKENKNSTNAISQELPAAPAEELRADAVSPAQEAEPRAERTPEAGPATFRKLRPISEARQEEGQSAGFGKADESEQLIVQPPRSSDMDPASEGESFSAKADAAGQTGFPGPEAVAQSSVQAPPPAPMPVHAPENAATGFYGNQTAKVAGQTPGSDYDFSAISRTPQETAAAKTQVVPAPGQKTFIPDPGAAPSEQNIPSAIQPPSQALASGPSPLSGQPGQTAQNQATTVWFTAQADISRSQGAAETVPVPHGDAAASLNETAAVIGKQTERVPFTFQSQKEDVQKISGKPIKGRRKMAFIFTLIAFGFVAALGLTLFFFSGGSFSEFSMLNFGDGKKQEAPEPAKSGQPGDGQGALPENAGQQPPAAAPVQPAFEAASNENTGKAIDTVKNYKLSGGRGTVEVWFANSFLSGSSSGSNEEWSATILHGDIFLVQYRLLRPQQEPLSYEFEVDVAKGVIVRGINNNAMELMESSAAPAPAPSAGKKRKSKASKITKPVKSGGIPILPLPEPSARAEQGNVPTGFETADLDSNEKVKYIVAQESDEELF